MATADRIVFKHTEVVEALLKKHGLHDGIWGLYVKFGLNAANMGPSPDELLPVAIVPVVEIGLQKFENEGNISVDASKVNPKSIKPRKGKSKPKHSGR